MGYIKFYKNNKTLLPPPILITPTTLEQMKLKSNSKKCNFRLRSWKATTTPGITTIPSNIQVKTHVKWLIHHLEVSPYQSDRFQPSISKLLLNLEFRFHNLR